MGDRKNETETGFNSGLTRRAFLGLVGKAAIVVGLVGLGGFIRFLSLKDRFIRPPGTVPEGEFLSLCIKCQKCQEVCPTGTITPVLLAEGVASVGTPKLDFRQGYCNLCMRCIEICPTGALQPTKEEEVRLGIAQVDRERCVAFTWRGCIKCYKECPYKAITLDSNQRPVVGASRCNGCGLCEYICPSSSLRTYTGSSGKGIVVVVPAWNE
jgi:ferredoxin-type protein NapG